MEHDPRKAQTFAASLLVLTLGLPGSAPVYPDLHREALRAQAAPQASGLEQLEQALGSHSVPAGVEEAPLEPEPLLEIAKRIEEALTVSPISWKQLQDRSAAKRISVKRLRRWLLGKDSSPRGGAISLADAEKIRELFQRIDKLIPHLADDIKNGRPFLHNLIVEQAGFHYNKENQRVSKGDYRRFVRRTVRLMGALPLPLKDWPGRIDPVALQEFAWSRKDLFQAVFYDEEIQPTLQSRILSDTFLMIYHQSYNDDGSPDQWEGKRPISEEDFKFMLLGSPQGSGVFHQDEAKAYLQALIYAAAAIRKSWEQQEEGEPFSLETIRHNFLSHYVPPPPAPVKDIGYILDGKPIPPEGAQLPLDMESPGVFLQRVLQILRVYASAGAEEQVRRIDADAFFGEYHPALTGLASSRKKEIFQWMDYDSAEIREVILPDRVALYVRGPELMEELSARIKDPPGVSFDWRLLPLRPGETWERVGLILNDLARQGIYAGENPNSLRVRDVASETAAQMSAALLLAEALATLPSGSVLLGAELLPDTQGRVRLILFSA